MHIDAALLSPVSALMGALIGAAPHLSPPSIPNATRIVFTASRLGSRDEKLFMPIS